MSFKKGDKIYGFAFYHQKWDWMIVESIQSDGKLFGNSIDGYIRFYLMYENTIVPEEVLESPLWKVLNEN